MEYVAFDFETANHEKASACSLGAVRVRNGIMEAHFYELIDPKTYFTPKNIAIHGILPEDVAGQADYAEVIARFTDFTKGLPVVSHSQFDRRVIQAENRRYRRSALGLDYFDSYQLARSIWAGKLPRFGLKPLSEQIKFEFNHHNALEDSRAAAYIIHALGLYTKSETVEELLAAAGVQAFYKL